MKTLIEFQKTDVEGDVNCELTVLCSALTPEEHKKEFQYLLTEKFTFSSIDADSIRASKKTSHDVLIDLIEEMEEGGYSWD